MGSKQREQVGANEVREWARSKGTFEGNFLNGTAEKPTRGRIPAAVISAFETETGKQYVTGHKVESTYEVKVVKRDKRGRKRTTKRTLTRAQVLEAAGESTSRKGVLSAALIETASANLSDPEPASA